MPTQVSAAKKPEEAIPKEAAEVEEKKPTPDWLGPKIYKGDTRV
jgi:hypothetical protein